MSLSAFALNCSLKSSPDRSSTDRLLDEVLAALREHDVETAGNERIADRDVHAGVSSDEGTRDDWPALRRQILDANIFALGTPIWMGHPSSNAQRVLERLDAFLGETDNRGRMISLDRVAIVVVVGNEDGAHHVGAELFQGLSDVGFTIPANGMTYWVGEAMHKTDYQDLPTGSDKTDQTTKTVAAHAAHLAQLLAERVLPMLTEQRLAHRPKERDADSQAACAHQPPSTARCVLAEALGTFALTAVAAGTVMATTLAHSDVHIGEAVAPGLVVMALIYAFGDISGAHFNPAVTLAFALRRDFTWRRVPAYWAAQLTGACAAALFLHATLGTVVHLGASTSRLTTTRTLTLEAVLTALLVTVILNSASRHSLIGTDAALAVGATIALCGLFAGTLSGASMNPARSVGPALIAGHPHDLWPYIVGPALGAAVAVALSFALHPHHDVQEKRAAQGEPDA